MTVNKNLMNYIAKKLGEGYGQKHSLEETALKFHEIVTCLECDGICAEELDDVLRELAK